MAVSRRDLPARIWLTSPILIDEARMQRYEFTVIPAPRRGEKARGVKTPEDRFALALTNLMNRMGAEGWDYVRADVLPCDERVGLTGLKTTYQNMLVFRRPVPLSHAAQPPATGAAEPTLILRAPSATVAAEVTPAQLAATLTPPVGAAPPLGSATGSRNAPGNAPPVATPRADASVD
jgi:hypothetical protein